MKRDVSTSTIGRDEMRKPQMDAYMLERRILFGCSLLIGLTLILWIVAISSDHWIIISGFGGIYIPETRRFFMKSHSGLWRICRHTMLPLALKNSTIIRNFTSISYQSASLTNEAKNNLSQLNFIQEMNAQPFHLSVDNFTDLERGQMFTYWILNKNDEFQELAKQFHILEVNKYQRKPKNMKPIPINPLNIQELKENHIFGNALVTTEINSTLYNLIIPDVVQAAIFKNWSYYPMIPKLLWPYGRALNLTPVVLNDNDVILQLVPPQPPKRGREANGFEYSPNRRCKYIDMFPSDDSLEMDLGFDDELMDYIRTQASFACITVMMMTMGCVFSLYTFLNPRYMFKRLAGGIHFISAATSIVVIQVLMASNNYTKTHLLYSYPDGAALSYGYGVYLAWIVFSSNMFAAIMFMWYSGKKKGSKAPTDEIAMADEAIGLGR